MDVQELFNAKGERFDALACGFCKRVWRSRAGAVDCCVCFTCKRPIEHREEGEVEHRECASKREELNQQKRLLRYTDTANIPETSGGCRVQRVPSSQYTGPVYCESLEDHCEGYFENVAELLDWCDEHGVTPPAWVTGCDIRSFTLDAEAAVDAASQDMAECVADGLLSYVDLGDLQRRLDDWTKAQKVPDTWTPDDTVAVILTTNEEKTNG